MHDSSAIGTRRRCSAPRFKRIGLFEKSLRSESTPAEKTGPEFLHASSFTDQTLREYKSVATLGNCHAEFVHMLH